MTTPENPMTETGAPEWTDQDGNPLPFTRQDDGSWSLVVPAGVTSIGPWPRPDGGQTHSVTVGRVYQSPTATPPSPRP